MENLMMGQIYLKRLPKSIYNKVEEDLNNLEIVSDVTYSEESKPRVEYGLIDGCLSFWQAYSSDDGIDLIEKNLDPEKNLTLQFNTKEEMERDFIPLAEYLAKAEFIGRRWRVPGNDEISRFINSLGEKTVLYSFDNILLVQNNHVELGPIFELIIRDPEAIEQDKCICEINELAEEYKDKAITYKRVYNYLSKNSKLGL